MTQLETKKRVDKVAVIGSGSWGTAVTRLLSPSAEAVCVWSFDKPVAEGINANHRNPVQLPDFDIPENVSASTSMQEVATGADALLLVVPSAFLRSTCKQLAPYLGADVPVLVLTKGIERGTGCLMAEIAEQELGGASRIAVLSGPNHAEEISKGTISAAVIAASDRTVAELFQGLLVCPAFRVYITDDVRGVEVCAAAKNVVALACGVVSALGAGDNTVAALMTRGLAEMSRLVVAIGGDPLTCMGLAGMGDLVVTCTSRHSRNRTFGEAFAKGESLADYQARTGMVVEGAEAAASIRELAESRGVSDPITRAVYATLYEKVPVEEVIDALLNRDPNQEFYGVVPGAEPGANVTE